MQYLLGLPDSTAFFDALQQEPCVSVRMNGGKGAMFNGNVPWCATGSYLAQRPTFTLDPLLHGGGYYVQEASSMFLAHVVRQITGDSAPLVALDLCAAPGGKSTLLLDFLPKHSLLVANEVIRSRAGVLVENLTKWGNPNVVATNNDPRDFSRLPHFFDLVVVDAPCSGEGMFRKSAKAREEWSEANVQLCAERQRRILADVWGSLKAGGYLVYCTCTFNTRENEDNVRWLVRELGAEGVEVAVPADWGITPSGELQSEAAQGVHGYRFFPHRVRGEGFFVAVVRKGEGRTSAIPRWRKCPKDGTGNDWLLNPESLIFSQKNDAIFAVKTEHSAHIAELEKSLRVLQCGVHVATLKGKDTIPTAALALSTLLNVAAFPTIDLDLHNALLYLKREPFASPSQSKGFELVRYEGLPLGFVKNLGNRCNNLFPQEWRIRQLLRCGSS